MKEKMKGNARGKLIDALFLFCIQILFLIFIVVTTILHNNKVAQLNKVERNERIFKILKERKLRSCCV